MKKEVIGKTKVDNRIFIMEMRGADEGFHDPETGYFYAMREYNRERMEIDVDVINKDDKVERSFSFKPTKMLGELLIHDMIKEIE